MPLKRIVWIQFIPTFIGCYLIAWYVFDISQENIYSLVELGKGGKKMKRKLSKTRYSQVNTLEAMGCGSCNCHMDCSPCSGGGSFYLEEKENIQIMAGVRNSVMVKNTNS